MRDYEELVKRLRESADWADHFAVLMGRDSDVSSEIKREAADAIEELQKSVELEYQSGFADGQISANRKKNRWISVEEALPEESGRYLVRYKRDIVLDYTEVHDDEVRIMRFFVGDGWRYPFLCQPELRKAEQQIVTHWMALPNLPAEENANG